VHTGRLPFAVPPTIESDDFMIFGEIGYQWSPHLQIACKTVNQNDGLTFARNDVPDVDAIGIEELISRLRLRRTWGEKPYCGT